MTPKQHSSSASEDQTHSSRVAWRVREFGSPNTDGRVSNRNQVTRTTVENPVEKVRPRTDHGILAVLSGGWTGCSCLESVLRIKRYSYLLSLASGVSDHD